MYQQIASNKRRSYLLIFVFFIFIIALGYAISYIFQYGILGMILALILALVMTLTGYYKGDKIVLSASGAKPLEKEDHPYLFHLVDGLSIAAGVPKPKVYVIPSMAINAFVTGKDPENSSLAVTQGALEKLNRQELEGVVAHEMSHIKNYDTRLMMLVAVLVGAVVILGNFAFRSFLWGGAGRKREMNQAQVIGAAVGIIFIILSPFIAQMIKFAISRRREYLADSSGAMLTRYPPGLASALEKIKNDQTPLKTASGATAHLYISNPLKGFTATMFSTHPPIDQRIKKLRDM